MSYETTFAQDIDDIEMLRAWAMELAEQVARRLRRNDQRGRTVHLKVRFSDFRTITRSETLAHPTNITQEIWQAANEMLTERMPGTRLAVRLLGVGVSGFQHSERTQLSLFDDEDVDDARSAYASLDYVADQIRERFGSASIGRASGLSRRAKQTP